MLRHKRSHPAASQRQRVLVVYSLPLEYQLVHPTAMAWWAKNCGRSAAHVFRQNQVGGRSQVLASSVVQPLQSES
jgi:hypothetical protein